MRKAFGMGALVCALPFRVMAAAPEWDPSLARECDRACLVDIMDPYMDAIYKHNPKLVPALALDVPMTDTRAVATPRAALLDDIPVNERLSRELLRAANSYFDALEGDNGRIAVLSWNLGGHSVRLNRTGLEIIETMRMLSFWFAIRRHGSLLSLHVGCS